MKKISLYIVLLATACVAISCAPNGKGHTVKHFTCDFEGSYWDALIDSDPNGANLLNGTIATQWHDQESDLAGKVTQPYEGWWEGLALSDHYSKDCANDGSPEDQLYIYADNAFSGKNALICNCFFGGVELRFESKSAYIESVMVASTTYLHNVVTNGNHLTTPLGENESIWIEAKGYINGSDEVQAKATFYLYKNGAPAFEGWKEWSLIHSMCKVDKVVFDIKWDGTGEYNPYPAYFALDDIKVARQVPLYE